jgi:protein arginine kinase
LVIDEHISRGDESNPPSAGSCGLACGIIVSSRIRLARNISDFPFLTACSENQLTEIESTVRAGLDRSDQLSDVIVVDAEQLEQLERRFLLQLHSATGQSSTDTGQGPTEITARQALDKNSTAAEAADSSLRPDVVRPDVVCADAVRPDAVCADAVRPDHGYQSSIDGVSLTLNDEDHLRIQVTRTGLDLENAWSQASRLDDLIEQQLNFAFSPRWGYLTACPANVGTGLRASVVLHLPALVSTGSIDSVLRCLNRANVSGRELFGEMAGSDFFRIGNQATLGHDEMELVRQVVQMIPTVVQAENEARLSLLAGNREEIESEVRFALQELLQLDWEDESEQVRSEITRLMSRVRMGISMELLGAEDVDRVREMLELVQLRHHLVVAVSVEDYRAASELRDRINLLEKGSP